MTRIHILTSYRLPPVAIFHVGFFLNEIFFIGIPYLNQEEESQLREQFEERRSQSNGSQSFISPSSCKGPINVPDEQKDFVNKVV